MKKIGLKPLGDLRGRFGMGWLFIGLMIAFCVSACSDDDDTVAPVFPAKQTIHCNVGEIKELSFEANTSWQLISSATWCRFVVDGQEEYSLSGGAGKQAITVKVTDEAQKNDGVSIAQVTLIMGDGRATIADVVRSAEGYELKIYNEDGQEIEQIEVGYDTYLSFKVKANFRFAATNRPDWVEIAGGSLVGAVNKEIAGKVRIIQNGQVEKYPVAAGNKHVITFADAAGKAFFSFPVVYKGMDPKAIKTTTPTANVWDWVVSLDGKSFIQQVGGSTSTSPTSFRNRIPFTIKVLNDDYEIVFIDEWTSPNGQKFFEVMDTDYSWMHCSGAKGSITLSVDAADPWTPSPERTGYVLAFPRAEYEAIKNNLLGNIIVDGDIAYKYQQSSLLIALAQKEIKQDAGDQSFIVKEFGMNNIPCVKCTDTTILNFLKNNYMLDADKVYTMPGIPGHFYSVNPLLTEAEWMGEAYAFDSSDNDIQGIVLEPGANQDGSMTLGVTLPEDVDRDVIVFFRKADGSAKALVITINN